MLIERKTGDNYCLRKTFKLKFRPANRPSPAHYSSRAVSCEQELQLQRVINIEKFALYLSANEDGVQGGSKGWEGAS